MRRIPKDYITIYEIITGSIILALITIFVSGWANHLFNKWELIDNYVFYSTCRYVFIGLCCGICDSAFLIFYLFICYQLFHKK